jgi:hypothetical protein
MSDSAGYIMMLTELIKLAFVMELKNEKKEESASMLRNIKR